MAGRATGWHHKRLVGDRALAAAYLPEARKWLGYLQNQRALGGAQREIRRELPDGAVITASLDGTIPTLTIDVRGVGGEKVEPDRLQGLIVTPGGPTGAGDYPEVVIGTPPNGATWRVVYFDADAFPAEWVGPRLQYSKSNPGAKPFLDAPDGLKNSGNIDWRNDTETLLVSWNGTSTRYFDDGVSGYGRGPNVFYKGAVLWTVASLPAEVRAREHGDLGVVVNGACLRKAGGRLWLIVALRTGRTANTPGGDTRYDTFYATPLAAPAGVTRVAGQSLEELPRLEAQYADSVLVYDHAIEPDTYDFGHPWLFNSDGTQARLIRPAFTTQIRESILTVGLDDEDRPGDALMESATEPWPTTTTTTRTEETYTVIKLSGTTDGIYNISAFGPENAVVPVSGVSVTAYGGGDHQDEYLTALEITVTTESSSSPKCAVDWVDGAWQYARWRPEAGEEVTTLAQTRDCTANASSSFDVRDLYRKTDGTFVESNCVFGGSHSGTIAESADWTRTVTGWSDDGMLLLPWGNSPGLNAATVAQTITGHFDKTITWAWASADPEDDPELDTPLRPPYFLYAIRQFSYGSSCVYNAAINDTRTTTAAAVQRFHYLDLRQGWLVYRGLTETYVITSATEGTQEFSADPPPTDALYVADLNGSSDEFFLAENAFRFSYNPLFTNPVGYYRFLMEDATTSGSTRTTRISLVVQKYGVALADQQLNLQVTTLGPVLADYGGNSYFGYAQRMGAGQVRTIADRTAADFRALPADTSTVLDPVTVVGSPSNADVMEDGYPIDGSGSWQQYRDTYAFAVSATYLNPTPVRFNGIYKGGVAEIGGIGALTQDAETRYDPIRVLPPTSTPITSSP